jgi:hypothetical protein
MRCGYVSFASTEYVLTLWLHQILYCLMRRLDGIARDRETYTMVKGTAYQARLLMVSEPARSDRRGMLIF